ncbi:MAG: 2OG-Fe(II) oxygenase [Alphaproteobacteria bacterium]|nr:2OG-Fe(II) oxygenase [Alphaproteobacteria bacterium]
MSAVIKLNDPAPWFDAFTITSAQISLSVKAGRWIALCFLGAFNDPAVVYTLAELLGEGKLFDDDHMNFLGVLTEPPQNAAQLAAASHKALGFIVDYDSALTRLYDTEKRPRLVILDPLLRFYANFPIGADGENPAMLRQFLRDLPPVDDYAGVPLTAPALIVPRVFEPAFCAQLIDLYEQDGGTESGFMLDEGGKTKTVIHRDLKSRKDFIVGDPVVRDAMRHRIATRLAPCIERFFQYRPTRMDRRIVSCYAAEDGGHFYRHRDNVNAAARHRRFAVSINLNGDYEGCELIFPEFGRRRYAAPPGGAIVFSTGALHQVLPITRGKRYAFVPFLYGENEARQRLANNALLQEGELVYTGEDDKLFPDV